MEEIKTAVKALSKAANALLDQAEKHKQSTNVPEICAFYKTVYESIEPIEKLLEVFKNIKTEYSKQVMPALFQSLNVDSINTSGRQFILNPEFHASMPQNKQEKGMAWLREKGYDMLIKEGVNAQTLTGAMKEYIQEKGELPPEDVMTLHIGHYISMRKK